MSNHCSGCGTVHEEDDDRPCSACQLSSFPVQKLDNKADWIAVRARVAASDINTEHFDGRLCKTEIAGIVSVVSMALWAAVNYERDRRKMCGESICGEISRTIRELIENGTITLETKVLGTLPMTADGCVAGFGAEVWDPGQVLGIPFRYGQSVIRISDCYSTREAAEAAREATNG